MPLTLETRDDNGVGFWYPPYQTLNTMNLRKIVNRFGMSLKFF